MSFVAAERVYVTIISLTNVTSYDNSIKINGIFQYQSSNFRNRNVGNPISLTNLNKFGSQISKKNENDITASFYRNSTLIINNLQNQMYVLKLIDNLDINQISQLNVSQNVDSPHIFNRGVVLLTENSNENFI